MPGTGAGVSKDAHKDRKEGGGTERILRFGIAENWSAENLVDFLTCVDDLYCFVYYVNELHKIISDGSSNPYESYQFDLLQNLVQEPSAFYRRYGRHGLQVNKLSYSSPGNFDFLGLGEVVGHVKDYLLETKRIRLQARKRELEDELLEQEIRSKIEETERQKLENDLLMEEIEAKRLANRHKGQEFQDTEERRQLELERLRTENLLLKSAKELKDKESELRSNRFAETSRLERESATNFLGVLGDDALSYLNSIQVAFFLSRIQTRIEDFFDEGKITDIQLRSEDRED